MRLIGCLRKHVANGNTDQTSGNSISETPPNSVESALCFARSGQSTGGTSRQSVGRAERERLIEWTSIYGKKLEPDFLIWYSRVGSGGEHSVYRNRESNRAIKVTHPNKFGHPIWDEYTPSTPVEYLNRLYLHNQLFGDDIHITGLILGDDHVQIVTSQPWIEVHPDNPIPESSEIDAFFDEHGFRRVAIGTATPFYFDEAAGILIGDARDENFIRDPEGELVPIDLVIGKPGPDLLQRIKAHLESDQILPPHL
jgi:hypothetical protein